MSRKRTYRTKEFKFKVALEAVKGQKQIAGIGRGVQGTSEPDKHIKLLLQGPWRNLRKYYAHGADR